MFFGSVCSGIEAASVAWKQIGWKASWLAEIEPFPSAVLEHHYPETPNLGDMAKIADKVKSKEVVAPDVLVGGTPCQAFSVAGMREGLADPRGELTIRYVELADAIDDVRRQRGEQPTIVVWENVPGVLSSKDNAFGCFLGALAGEDSELQPAGKRWSNSGCVYGPKRAIAWRVLDAQYFGLAQRRKRVFLVASAREGFDPAKVLFEFDSVRRDIAPCREKGESTAHTIAPSLTASGRGVGRVGDTRGQDPVVAVPYRMVAFGEYADDESASTMKARDYKDATDLVCVNGSHHGSHHGSRAVVVHGTQDPIISMDRAHSLGRNAGQENAVLAFRACGQDGFTPSDLSPTLLATDGGGVTPSVYYSYENGGNAVEPMHDISPFLTAADRHGVLPTNTMAVQGRPSDDLNPRMGSGIGSPGDPQNTLTKAHMHGVFDPEIMRVRRLTPVECERLQGFPDNYTKIEWRGKPAEECPDGHRYKALGNSMAVPCMTWIGKRIQNLIEEQSWHAESTK